MTLEEFSSAEEDRFTGALLALWWDDKGNWQKAHEIAQEISTGDGAWVHAYLHRKEGDEGNAAYWYRRAGRAMARGDLRSEWELIAGEMLARAGAR